MRRPPTTLRPTLFIPCLGTAARAAAGARARARTGEVPAVAPALRGDASPPAADDFAWPGVYDIEGPDFPEGRRRAVVTITPRGDRYAVELEGPPGRLGSARFVGDSVYIAWDLVAGGPTMHLRLHGAGDSLGGSWSVAGLTGPVVGRRR